MIIKIVIGLFLFTLTSIVGYLFRIRQLYAVVPKLYRTSLLSQKGSVSEIIIYNKGNKVEEDISLQIDQDIKCELLATNSSEIKLENNTINIPRLHNKSEISLIVFVEEKTITKNALISLSSKECKGKIYQSIDEIPPNYSDIIKILGVIILIGTFLISIPGIKNYVNDKWPSEEQIKLKKESLGFEKQKANLKNKGWTNIDNYLSSDLSKSYSKQEFPIRFIKTKIDRRFVRITYEIINKSALPIKVTISEINVKNNYWYDNHISKSIKTLSKSLITIEALRQKSGIVNIAFNIQYSNEVIYTMVHGNQVEPWKELSDKKLETMMIGQWGFGKKCSYYGIVKYESNGNYTTNVWEDQEKSKLLLTYSGKWYINHSKIYHTTDKIKPKTSNAGMKEVTTILNLTNDKIVLGDEKDDFFMLRFRIK